MQKNIKAVNQQHIDHQTHIQLHYNAINKVPAIYPSELKVDFYSIMESLKLEEWFSIAAQSQGYVCHWGKWSSVGVENKNKNFCR